MKKNKTVAIKFKTTCPRCKPPAPELVVPRRWAGVVADVLAVRYGGRHIEVSVIVDGAEYQVKPIWWRRFGQYHGARWYRGDEQVFKVDLGIHEEVHS